MSRTLIVPALTALAVSVSPSLRYEADALARTAVAIQAASPQRTAAPFVLSVDSIMRGPDLVGYPPSGLRWAGDSSRLYFEWRRAGDPDTSTWVVARGGGEPRQLTDDERRRVPPPAGPWDRQGRRVLAVQDGDIVVLDSVAETRFVVTRTTDAESAPRWARGGTHVTFVRSGQVFVAPAQPEADVVLQQLADIGPKKPDPRLTDAQRYLKEQELELLGAVKDAAERREREEARRKRYALSRFDLAERQSVVDAVLDPKGRFLYLLVADRPSTARTAQVPNYVTESAYTEDIATRTKVGDAQDGRRLAVLDLESGKSVWATLPDAVAGAPAPPGGNEAADRPPPGDKDEKNARAVRWSLPLLSDAGRAVAAARAMDNKDRWIVALDPETGATRILDALHDDAWVRDLGGPGGPAMGWLEGDREFWFTSERDGWMHLYLIDVTAPTPTPRQLTSGAWEITDVDVSLDRRTFYMTTTEVHPGERHLYSMPAAGGPRTRLTTTRGAHAAAVSPDGAMLGLVSSASNRPPEVFLAKNEPGAAATRVTTSTSAEWRSFPWVVPEVIQFTARDGVRVPARLFTPEMVGARRHRLRPGVVFVHGAGYTQNAHHYWSSYYREYMFHHLLASRGYVVLDVDYRASSGYGRDWRTAIYRHMGGKDLDDVVDGARYLAATQRVDPGRIGVYGGSYGGFLTLMAMFTAPGTFAAGAALRPVTDWAHYSNGYTSNILNLPADDAEAYRRSSPIYFAEGLQGALLICHGMVDTNVHFQDSVRLAQRLIELRKDNWELAVYPVENHGFERETSWADEYGRILRLFDTHLRGRDPQATDRNEP